MDAINNELERIKKQMTECYVEIQESLRRNLTYIEQAESPLYVNHKKTSWETFQNLIEKKQHIVNFPVRYKKALGEKELKALIAENSGKEQDAIDLAYWHWADPTGEKESYVFTPKAVTAVANSLNVQNPKRFNQQIFECKACSYKGTYSMPRYYEIGSLRCPSCKHHLRWGLNWHFGWCSCKRCLAESEPTHFGVLKYSGLYQELTQLLDRLSGHSEYLTQELNLHISGSGRSGQISSYDLHQFGKHHRVITRVSLQKYHFPDDERNSPENDFEIIFDKIKSELKELDNKSSNLVPISIIPERHQKKRIKNIVPIANKLTLTPRTRKDDRRIYLISSSKMSKGFEDAKHILDESSIAFSSIFISGHDEFALKEKLMSYGFRKDDIVAIVRGGGDLLNHESAKAFRSKELNDIVIALKILGVTIITGIGHATDKLEIDKAASICAITPTAAAMKIVELIMADS